MFGACLVFGETMLFQGGKRNLFFVPPDGCAEAKTSENQTIHLEVVYITP